MINDGTAIIPNTHMQVGHKSQQPESRIIAPTQKFNMNWQKRFCVSGTKSNNQTFENTGDGNTGSVGLKNMDWAKITWSCESCTQKNTTQQQLLGIAKTITRELHTHMASSCLRNFELSWKEFFALFDHFTQCTIGLLSIFSLAEGTPCYFKLQFQEALLKGKGRRRQIIVLSALNR